MRAGDYSSCTHSVNVSIFAVALACRTRLRELAELKEFAAGVLLHDIGKRLVPLELLTKAGKLTPDEMTLMRRHVEFGERILQEAGAITPARMLPVSLHHEKLNGEGYPRGLANGQIHLYGRIAAIADCYDAMTTNRSYQAALTSSEALRRMKGRLREHFDQQLLDGFIGMLTERAALAVARPGDVPN